VVTFATATPVANSIAELWSVQTYLQPDVLAAADLAPFDSWVATFGRTVTALELAPDGAGYRMQTRFARFQNVPELLSLYRQVADVRTSDDLHLPVPVIAGGAPETVVVPASERLAAYVAELAARAERVRSRAVDPAEDNMLKITGDGRRAALDLRLVGEQPDPDRGKLRAAADRIAAIHSETRGRRYLDALGEPADRPGALQLVFCDASTPSGRGWNAYDELRSLLVERGLPRDAVRFIHEATTDEAKDKLFAACRDGRVAVLMGSTDKMGLGTNVQARALALHHLDCPWRPADIEQRDGRILRQGNQNPEVRVIRYATEGSFDIYMCLVDRTTGSTTRGRPAGSMAANTALERRQSSARSRMPGARIRLCGMCPPSRCGSMGRSCPTSMTCRRSGCRSRRIDERSVRRTPTWPIWPGRSLGLSRCVPTRMTSCGGCGSWTRSTSRSTRPCAATTWTSGGGCWRAARPVVPADPAPMRRQRAG
jgi:hypothetical protein